MDNARRYRLNAAWLVGEGRDAGGDNAVSANEGSSHLAK
jgi:hypothetical protein